jgi:hypothetical protein
MLCRQEGRFSLKKARRNCYSISKAIVSLLPSPCRATALSAARRLDTIDLEMELVIVRDFFL